MKYREWMAQIKVTPDMRRRILKNIEAAVGGDTRARQGRKTLLRGLSLAACLVLMLGVWAFSTQKETPPTDAVGSYGVLDWATVQALSQEVGFAVRAPQELPFETEDVIYSTLFGELAQIEYAGHGVTVTARMARGNDDISGDYNDYAESSVKKIASHDVLLRGDQDGVAVAAWTDGDFTYSLSAQPQISLEDMTRMIESYN